ncbi:MAG: hypothetical protein V9G20_26810 [Candidatus Promineifilaceae bacterium]
MAKRNWSESGKEKIIRRRRRSTQDEPLARVPTLPEKANADKQLLQRTLGNDALQRVLSSTTTDQTGTAPHDLQTDIAQITNRPIAQTMEVQSEHKDKKTSKATMFVQRVGDELPPLPGQSSVAGVQGVRHLAQNRAITPEQTMPPATSNMPGLSTSTTLPKLGNRNSPAPPPTADTKRAPTRQRHLAGPTFQDIEGERRSAPPARPSSAASEHETGQIPEGPFGTLTMGAGAEHFMNRLKLAELEAAAPPPGGFIEGLETSKFFYMLPADRQEKVQEKKEEIVARGARGESWTLLDEQLVQFVAEQLTQYREDILGKEESTRSKGEERTLKYLGKLAGIADKRQEAIQKPAQEEAIKTLGILPENLAAMKTVAGMRGKEALSIRAVADDGNAAAQAIAHQQAGFPTKPFSIKLKSETDTGLVPADQFNETGKADNCKTGKADGLTQLAIILQLAEFGKRVVQTTLETAYKAAQKVNPDVAEEKKHHIDDLYRDLKAKPIDNHEIRKVSDIKAKATGSQREYLEDLFASIPDDKEYIVSASKGLPIVGDYDIYQLFSQKLPGSKGRLGQEQTSIRAGAGMSSKGLMGAAIDYNVGVALSGYKGGLVIHHGAEMDNTVMPQNPGALLALNAKKHHVIQAGGEAGFQPILEDAMKQMFAGKSTRFNKPFHQFTRAKGS